MSEIPKISTGQPSTLKTYRAIARVLSGGENTAAVKFFDEKIKDSPKGEHEIVIADERQVMYLIFELIRKADPGYNPDNDYRQ